MAPRPVLLRNASTALACAICLLAGCFPKPYSSSLSDAAAHIAQHYDLVFPDAKLGDAVGVLRPRFGAPAIVTGASFSMQMLERGPRREVGAVLVRSDLGHADVAACPADDCIRLQLVEQPAQRIDALHVMRTFVATAPTRPDVHGYDLVVTSTAGSERLHRAVFFRDAAPKGPLTVVQLSDPHLGRLGQRDRVVERLDRAITAINELHPDVVIVTGDIADDGNSRALQLTARNALYRIAAPVLVTLGNHDYGRWPRLVGTSKPDAGFYRFAGVFHALRLFTTTVDGWDFVGFDTGPAVYSPRVITRGIAPETQQGIFTAIEVAARAGRGVVLFSHAPTRGALSSKPSAEGSHQLGSMHVGGDALERELLAAARRGEQVVHLAGHTHWSDLFVASEDGSRFVRVPYDRLPCEVPLPAGATLVTAPSVTRISFPTLRHGNAFGMVVLRLGKDHSTSQFLLLDQKEQAVQCPGDSRSPAGP